MDFTVIENEMVGQTGYSRRQLQNFREGSTQKKGNTVYTAEAILIQGKDWERYGRAILYAPDTVAKLQARRNLNGSE